MEESCVFPDHENPLQIVSSMVLLSSREAVSSMNKDSTWLVIKNSDQLFNNCKVSEIMPSKFCASWNIDEDDDHFKQSE